MTKIAIIQTGGKQYVVGVDSVLKVERVAADKNGKINFDKVLLLDDGKSITVGAPFVKDAIVCAEVVEEGRNQKVSVIRYRQKSRYFKKKGHRQHYTRIKITSL